MSIRIDGNFSLDAIKEEDEEKPINRSHTVADISM